MEQRDARFVATREINDAVTEQLNFGPRVGQILCSSKAGVVEIEFIGRHGGDRRRGPGKQIKFAAAEIGMGTANERDGGFQAQVVCSGWTGGDRRERSLSLG